MSEVDEVFSYLSKKLDLANSKGTNLLLTLAGSETPVVVKSLEKDAPFIGISQAHGDNLSVIPWAIIKVGFENSSYSFENWT